MIGYNVKWVKGVTIGYSSYYKKVVISYMYFVIFYWLYIYVHAFASTIAIMIG